MRTATVTIDAERVSPARSLAALARAAAHSGGPLVCVTGRMFTELERELGGPEGVARRLCRVATTTGRPICVNLPTGPERSTTVFVSPRGWSVSRLAGWAARKHDELEAAFGPARVAARWTTGGSRRRDAALLPRIAQEQ